MPVETRRLEGHPAPRILSVAREWGAGLVVIGRSERGSAGPHYVGAQTRHVLEFSDVPVLVVPQQAGTAEAGCCLSRRKALSKRRLRVCDVHGTRNRTGVRDAVR